MASKHLNITLSDDIYLALRKHLVQEMADSDQLFGRISFSAFIRDAIAEKLERLEVIRGGETPHQRMLRLHGLPIDRDD